MQTPPARLQQCSIFFERLFFYLRIDFIKLAFLSSLDKLQWISLSTILLPKNPQKSLESSVTLTAHSSHHPTSSHTVDPFATKSSALLPHLVKFRAIECAMALARDRWSRALEVRQAASVFSLNYCWAMAVRCDTRPLQSSQRRLARCRTASACDLLDLPRSVAKCVDRGDFCFWEIGKRQKL